MSNLSRVEIYDLQKKVHQNRVDLLRNQNTSIENIFEFIELVELLNSEVQKLKATAAADDPLLTSSEDVLSFSAHNILLASHKQDDQEESLASKYRQVWRQNFSLFIFTSALFLISIIVGYAMTLAVPDYSSLFISQQMIENIMDQEAWFERIRLNPMSYGFQIALNNIMVSLTAFSLGAVAGIGGIYILAFNGLMLGSIVAFCQIYGFEKALLNFIVGHGPLELTLIVAAVFGSFVFGRTFYQFPYNNIGHRMKENAKDALHILYGVTLWLCIAAIIEVGVSPWNFLDAKGKIGVGLLAAAAFWYWTFKPEPSRR